MKKNYLEILIWSFVVIVGIMACVQLHAKAQAKAENAAKDRWYAKQEQNLLKDVRQHLSDKGFENSGVTLTRVLSGTDSRSYTFKIHHQRIDRMTPEERVLLSEELLQLTEGYKRAEVTDTCEFRCEFLILHDNSPK